MQVDNPKAHRLALDNAPELATQVGLLLSCFAILELSPPHMLAKLTGMSHEDADTTLGHFRSFNSRLDLIEAIAKARPTADTTAAEILALLPKIRDCNTIRNRYAHSLWQQEQGGMRLISWLSDATRETKARFVTEASIKEDCATLRGTLHAAINYSQIVVPQLP
jgi:hypothetical protein